MAVGAHIEERLNEGPRIRSKQKHENVITRKGIVNIILDSESPINILEHDLKHVNPIPNPIHNYIPGITEYSSSWCAFASVLVHLHGHYYNTPPVASVVQLVTSKPSDVGT